MEIRYQKKAKKFLSKQTPENQKRITSAIENIPSGNADIKKLVGTKYFRLRVGNFRVIFDIYGNIIDIIDIGNRGEIYKQGRI